MKKKLKYTPPSRRVAMNEHEVAERKKYRQLLIGLPFDDALLILQKRGFINCEIHELNKINEYKIPYSHTIVKR